ncbi:DUF523 domain-containing protein [Actinocorallia sp. B10E7]|uniref:DUF523 domain-containing protein n=1 Tax=Actinocorallia sp. B10E7 TaxID=3153558 RepID=UPI00325F5976
MERVLVSGCLLGQPVRYDGKAKTNSSDILARWRTEGRVVPFCPELAGGLGVPRPPAELQAGRVITVNGQDVTDAFTRGAELALAAARNAGARIAVLKEGSPSCGSGLIADGTFGGGKIPGEGLTTALLRAHGITVFNEEQFEAADALLSD